MYEPASLSMFQCRLQRILCDFEVIMFFPKDPPQTEGRRNADPGIKTWPEFSHSILRHTTLSIILPTLCTLSIVATFLNGAMGKQAPLATNFDEPRGSARCV